jgi:Na+-transporting methylmalonyl-CoA/oxaloacetate decarboxylase gamma subunit
MNNLDFILAVSGTDVPTHTSDTLEVVGVGFSFVMVVLALLALVTALIGAIFIRIDVRASAAAAAASAAAAAEAAEALKAATSDPEALDYESSVATASESGEDPALVAVIAAAVHTVIGDRAHRIVSIRPRGPGWAQEGRRQIFSSHRVR